MSVDPELRFWPKVRKEDGCWLWTAAMRGPGYGEFYDGTRLVQAHRFAYELLVGPIPEGLILDHLCRNRRCVNPAHLEPVTHSVNILRGTGMSARRARQTHCIHGHPFDEANTLVGPNGWRKCRACNRRMAAEHRKRVPDKRRNPVAYAAARLTLGGP